MKIKIIFQINFTNKIKKIIEVEHIRFLLIINVKIMILLSKFLQKLTLAFLPLSNTKTSIVFYKGFERDDDKIIDIFEKYNLFIH